MSKEESGSIEGSSNGSTLRLPRCIARVPWARLKEDTAEWKEEDDDGVADVDNAVIVVAVLNDEGVDDDGDDDGEDLLGARPGCMPLLRITDVTGTCARAEDKDDDADAACDADGVTDGDVTDDVDAVVMVSADAG